MRRYKHGLVIGKFIIPHLGHDALIQKTMGLCDKVTIFVVSKSTDPIPGHLRYQWMKNTYQDDLGVGDPTPVTIVHVFDDSLPSSKEDPDHDKIWTSVVNDYGPYDAFFTGNDYGPDFANTLGVAYESLDRSILGISATLIRSDPIKYWNWILFEARPYFAIHENLDRGTNHIV